MDGVHGRVIDVDMAEYGFVYFDPHESGLQGAPTTPSVPVPLSHSVQDVTWRYQVKKTREGASLTLPGFP